MIDIVKKFNSLLFFDFGGIGSYVKIDMKMDIDGIYLSTHKFLGGPGSSGLAIFKNSIYHNYLTPTHGGGGTVELVNENTVVYCNDISKRELSGTPGIL